MLRTLTDLVIAGYPALSGFDVAADSGEALIGVVRTILMRDLFQKFKFFWLILVAD